MHTRQVLCYRATMLDHTRWLKSTLKVSKSCCELKELNMLGKGFWCGGIGAALGSRAG